MDDILLLDAVERYMNGDMSAEERTYFEEIRKNNPEVDQMVVEHTFFLTELDAHAAIKAYKHSLHEVESKLADEGIVTKSQLKGKAKIVYLWKRYKRSVAVAASIAGIISITTATLMIAYTNQVNTSNKEDLIATIKKTEAKVDAIDDKVNAGSKVKSPAVVVPNPDYRATGFLIDGKGYLVTNAHVVNRLKTIYVENNKGEFYQAISVYADKTSDLAILKIVQDNFKPITNLPYTLRKNNLDLAEQIFTLGFPRNEIVYGEGYLSAKSGNDGDSTAYQLTVSANPGNSGGPVLNKNGEIIGIITSKEKNSDGVVYAAKAKNIFKLIEELKKTDTSFNLKAPTGTALKGLERPQQVKKMEDYVFMVVGN
jgi:serine protease Do